MSNCAQFAAILMKLWTCGGLVVSVPASKSPVPGWIFFLYLAGPGLATVGKKMMVSKYLADGAF